MNPLVFVVAGFLHGRYRAPLTAKTKWILFAVAAVVIALPLFVVGAESTDRVISHATYFLIWAGLFFVADGFGRKAKKQSN